MMRGTEEEANLRSPDRDNVAIAKNGLSNNLAVNRGNGLSLDRKNAASISIKNDAQVLLPNPRIVQPQFTILCAADPYRKTAGQQRRTRLFPGQNSKLKH